MERKVILFELDALLDTRLPVLAKLSGQAAQEAIVNYYMERISDDPAGFCNGITKTEFDAAYKERDLSILKQSRPTMLMHMLSTIFQEINVQKVTGDPNTVNQQIEIAINTWPYRLNQSEKINIIRMVRAYASTPIYRYKVFDQPISSFDLKTMADADIAVAYVYNFDQWYTGAFGDPDKVSRCSAGMSFYTPALLRSLDQMATVEDMKEQFQMESIDPFLGFKEIHQEFLYIDFLKSDVFSLDPRHLIPTE